MEGHNCSHESFTPRENKRGGPARVKLKWEEDREPSSRFCFASPKGGAKEEVFYLIPAIADGGILPLRRRSVAARL